MKFLVKDYCFFLADSALRKWTFPLSEHSNLSSKLKKHIPEVLITGVPVTLINALLSPEEPEQVDWSKIDKTLRDSLMPFQVEGVR